MNLFQQRLEPVWKVNNRHMCNHSTTWPLTPSHSRLMLSTFSFVNCFFLNRNPFRDKLSMVLFMLLSIILTSQYFPLISCFRTHILLYLFCIWCLRHKAPTRYLSYNLVVSIAIFAACAIPIGVRSATSHLSTPILCEVF